MKIWKWQCSRYLRNHGFPLREKFQFLKFRYTEDIHKNVFWVFFKSTIVFDIHGHFFIILSKYYLKKLNLKLGIKSSDTYDKENMKLTVSHKGKKCSKIFSYIYCLISQKDFKKIQALSGETSYCMHMHPHMRKCIWKCDKLHAHIKLLTTHIYFIIARVWSRNVSILILLLDRWLSLIIKLKLHS